MLLGVRFEEGGGCEMVFDVSEPRRVVEEVAVVGVLDEEVASLLRVLVEDVAGGQ